MNYISCLCILSALCVSFTQPPEKLKEEAKPRVPVYTDSLHTTHELIGPLGKPLGEVLTVTGTVRREEDTKQQLIYIEITELNGVAMKMPVKMYAHPWQWSNSIKELKPGQRMTVRAYQDGGMRGHPDQAMMETTFIQTTGFGFSTWLVVLKEVPASK